MTELFVQKEKPADCANDVAMGGSPQSCRAGRALILLNLVRDSGSLVLDHKVFQYFLNRGWTRSDVEQAVDDLVGSVAIRINADSQSSLELEVIA